MLGWLASAGFATRMPALIGGQASSALVPQRTLEQDPLRPQFHLLPARNWMNDPNGPIYVNGKYHMFFQYNPESAVWGNMSWAHAVSDDMVHWKNLPVAFTMSPEGPDAAGCFSGSAIVVTEHEHQRVYMIYTGIVRDREHATARSEDIKESQCLSWSDDPMLRSWNKLDKPIIPGPPEGLKTTGFRDPSPWKHGNDYLMTVGSGLEREGGCVLLYRSSDLRQWEYLHPLTNGKWNGVPTPNPCDDGEMWECPEFFALDGGYVLVYSTLGKNFWQSGEFDEKTLRFHPRKEGVLDWDAFYAAKTQLDAKGKRILWGWIPERRSKQEMLAAGWSGMMSLPRELRLDKSGELFMSFATETQSLRDGLLPAQKSSNGTSCTLPKATGEFACLGTKGQRFEVVIKAGEQELARMKYESDSHVLTVGNKRFVLQPRDQPQIHAFVDGSVLEILIAQRIGYTTRFYYPGGLAPDVSLDLTGSAQVKAWRVKPISPNRLTSV